MRCVVTWVIDGLPLDPRSRRALDETLLDWAHEEAEANSLRQQAATMFRAIAAVSRAVTSAVGQEVIHLPCYWLAGRVVLCAAIPSAALMWFFYRGTTELRALAPAWTGIELSALLVPHELEILLPLVFLVASASAMARRAPSIGLALVASSATLLFCLWLEPAANSRFWSEATALWQPTHPHSSYGSRGWGLSAVARAMQDWAHVIFGFLAFKIALSGLAGALAWLGAVDPFRGGVWRRAALWIAIPVLYVGGLLVFSGGDVINDYMLTAPRPATWCCAWAFASLAIVVFIRATRGRRWWLLAPVVFVCVMQFVLPDDWRFLYRAYDSNVAPWWMGIIAVTIALALTRSDRRDAEARAIPPTSPATPLTYAT